MYKTIVIDYEPIAKDMTDTIEEVCNKQLKEKLELVALSITSSDKAILVFKSNYEEIYWLS